MEQNDFLDFIEELLNTTSEGMTLSKEYLESRKRHARRSLVPLRVEGSESVPAYDSYNMYNV